MKRIVMMFFAVTTMLMVSGCDQDEVFNAEEQLDIDVRLIQEFLDNNNLTAEVDQNTELRYIVTRTGTGDNATFGNSVEVHYTGYLLDGTEFDTSIGRGTFNFVLGRGDVIPGWDVGFQNYNIGSEGTLLIPSGLAYGAGRGPTGTLPPNSVLAFDISVVDIR